MSETPEQAKVRLVNRALVRIGVSPSYSVDEETHLGGIVDTTWPNVEARVFSPPFDWSFARQTQALARLSATPQNGWAYGFALPGTRIGAPLAILSEAGQRERLCRDFRIEGGNVYTNEPQAWARIRVKSSPESWDEGFALAFVTALASGLAVPLREDEDRAAQLDAEAFGPNFARGQLAGLFGALHTSDRASSQQTGRGFIATDPLTAARL